MGDLLDNVVVRAIGRVMPNVVEPVVVAGSKSGIAASVPNPGLKLHMLRLQSDPPN